MSVEPRHGFAGVPSWRMLQGMVKRIGAKVTNVPASHAEFFTQPQVVADVIDEAARMQPQAISNTASTLPRSVMSGRAGASANGRKTPDMTDILLSGEAGEMHRRARDNQAERRTLDSSTLTAS